MQAWKVASGIVKETYFNSSVQLLFFIINRETGSAQKYKTPKVIKERLSDIIILLISTRKHSFLLLLSATKRETAIWTPPQLRAMQKTSTGKINWKIPIPFAPIKFDRNILYKKPIILLKRLAMVRIIVPLIIGFLLSIVYCLKRIYIKYSKKQELCKNNNYNNIKRADNQLFRKKLKFEHKTKNGRIIWFI